MVQAIPMPQVLRIESVGVGIVGYVCGLCQSNTLATWHSVGTRSRTREKVGSGCAGLALVSGPSPACAQTCSPPAAELVVAGGSPYSSPPPAIARVVSLSGTIRPLGVRDVARPVTAGPHKRTRSSGYVTAIRSTTRPALRLREGRGRERVLRESTELPEGREVVAGKPWSERERDARARKREREFVRNETP
jgi:hypothetical protein